MHISLGAFSREFQPWKPADGRVFDFFAYDTETTDIDRERPDLTPLVVLGTACDGRRGFFVPRGRLKAFFEVHRGVPFVCHYAPFDLRVTDMLLKPEQDIYETVEHKRVWDTLILKRLHSLATAGQTARGSASLAACAKEHLGVALAKKAEDEHGQLVRTGFGKFLHRPQDIPPEYLAYAAQDALATWHLYAELKRLVQATLAGSTDVWGYGGPDGLRDVLARFGPLTHHVHLRAAILMDALTANGIAIDTTRSAEKARALEETVAIYRESLRLRGYLPGEKGCEKALQSIIREVVRANPGLGVRTTATGKWGTAEEDLTALAEVDPFFADLDHYKTAQKLLATYMRKMSRARLHPKFGYLLATGRTYCGGGFNLQNLPREKDAPDAAATIRGCFVPAEGHVFIDSDYGQIELVVLAYALDRQFGFGDTLKKLINEGKDLHKLIAAAVLGKQPDEVTKAERDSAKPVSFGRPGGMGAPTLQKLAKSSYGKVLTLEEVQERIDTYHHLCPELDPFMRDSVDTGLAIASAVGLTPAAYCAATGCWQRGGEDAVAPQGWLGGMLLKVLHDEAPSTRQGRPYSAEEIDFFWERAQSLADVLDGKLQPDLRSRRPGPKLCAAVRDWVGRRPVFTLTGRLRAGATFCSSRNCVFQGPAADGAILGLWKVWRAGYRIVNFVHDQVVVEVPADVEVPHKAAAVERLMKEGMAEVLPNMLVKVETAITRSLSKLEPDPRYPAVKAAAPVPAA
jgi:DNA polymerase I